MALSAFTDKQHPPTDVALRETLGAAHTVWTNLIDAVTQRINPVDQIWGFTSASTGWGLRLRQKDRALRSCLIMLSIQRLV